MKHNGFTFPYENKDVFVETEHKNVTRKLCMDICRKMQIPDGRWQEVKYFLRPATLEVRTLSNGRQMYEIAGDNFGGRGSFTDDGLTIVIRL